jgi:hypothetical protein
MSKDYNVITNNNVGVFPLVQAINSSGPLIPDGSEIIDEVIDDVWLEKQALLDFYDYPPLGSPDLAGVFGAVFKNLPISQPLALQYMNYATPGTIVNWASEIDPAVVGATLGLGMEIRLLLLHGQGILRADYLMLDAIVYVGDLENATADSFYHADDDQGAVRNIAGDYLILPDARGYSFRGLDPSGLIDPEGAGRIVGSEQEDALQEITGEFPIMQKEGGTNNHVVFQSGGGGALAVEQDFIQGPTNTQIASYSSPVDKTLDRVLFNASASLGTNVDPDETRGKNIATHFAIHY